MVSIDDDPTVLSALRRLFRNEPFEFLATEKPDEAMDWILDRQADLVVADQRMPAMSGLDLLEMVQICSPSTIRVMLTAHSELTEVMKLRKIGAIQRLLRKPWDADDLKRTIRELLANGKRQAGGGGRGALTRCSDRQEKAAVERGVEAEKKRLEDRDDDSPPPTPTMKDDVYG